MTEDYEALRAQRIAENKALLISLGLDRIVDEIPSTPPRKRAAPKSPRVSRAQSVDSNDIRRSSRIRNEPTTFFALDDDMDDESWGPHRKRKYGGYSKNMNPGRRIQGGRIYDSVHGTSCHQCRQKTIDPKVKCTNRVDGGLCGVMLDALCLTGRYGESLDDAIAGNWVCPKCRGVCNCSICRKKSGLAPTGQLKNLASELGFSSVMDYLSHQPPRKSRSTTERKIVKTRSEDKENDVKQPSCKIGRIRKPLIVVEIIRRAPRRVMTTNGVKTGAARQGSAMEKERETLGSIEIANGKQEPQGLVEISNVKQGFQRPIATTNGKQNPQEADEYEENKNEENENKGNESESESESESKDYESEGNESEENESESEEESEVDELEYSD